jgi:hypothetical protein
MVVVLKQLQQTEVLIMQQTLIAVFDNRGDAQKAMEELVSCGYPRDQVRLSEGDPAGDAARQDSATASTDAAEHTFTAGIRHFFSDLFGRDRSESAQMYAEAVSRGNYVLTLTADSLPEVERAADIVERFGPIDIDEHAARWSGAGSAAPGMRSSAGAMQQSQPGSQQFAQEGPAQQRADSTAIPGIEEERKVGKRQLDRGGVRIYPRVIETPGDDSVGLREAHINVERHRVSRPYITDTVRSTEVQIENLAPDDDAYFRGHWSSTFAREGGTYEDFAPAYSYGSTMARSDLYRGRAWHDVEHNLRSDWEARHPHSTWEKIKAAVRHGWERITA